LFVMRECTKKYKFVSERDCNYYLLRDKDNILNLLKNEGVCNKTEFIGGLKWGYNRKKMCKNILH